MSKRLIILSVLFAVLLVGFVFRQQIYEFYSPNTVTDQKLKETIELNNQAVDAFAEQLADRIRRDNPTTYQQIGAAHDFIISNVEYDDEAAENLENLDDDTITSMTAYGALIEHRAICTGYAAAFKLLMDKLNIECGIIDGLVRGGVMHRWNYVCLDGNYYHVDVTFDDYDSEEISHHYLLVTDEVILKERVIITKNIPACDGPEILK